VGHSPGSITDVQLGGASGGTEVIVARLRRIGKKYYKAMFLTNQISELNRAAV